ncbi:MAG TPA: adenylate/guanylate cyclase domain-containing protein, partial [Candidatus Sulfotelmatobacter sp.]|nr:adenylate/guanylate cyclase domain-containing protein [Candidatus Sulfotelmatobacter sp.]
MPNPASAKFCWNCGKPLEAPRAHEGERKIVSVLFADVVGSTAIGEQLDPEQVTEMMNGAFALFNAAIDRYGGTVSRLMGDAVLALFGAPIAHEDDAERAVHAGLEIQEAAQRYARMVKDTYGVDFLVRVGIHTGLAVLDKVGDDVRAEYTAMGDTANVAARLQTAATPGTVLVSADTYRLVRPLFDAELHGAIEAKGKSVPLEAYEILRTKAVPGTVRGIEGVRSPLVGRDRELH